MEKFVNFFYMVENKPKLAPDGVPETLLEMNANLLEMDKLEEQVAGLLVALHPEAKRILFLPDLERTSLEESLAWLREMDEKDPNSKHFFNSIAEYREHIGADVSANGSALH